jgi:hypothetical protein
VENEQFVRVWKTYKRKVFKLCGKFIKNPICTKLLKIRSLDFLSRFNEHFSQWKTHFPCLILFHHFCLIQKLCEWCLLWESSKWKFFQFCSLRSFVLFYHNCRSFAIGFFLFCFHFNI